MMLAVTTRSTFEAKRARIILLADEGVAYLEIARCLMITKQPPDKAGGFELRT
jgi:hypothetical protein